MQKHTLCAQTLWHFRKVLFVCQNTELNSSFCPVVLLHADLLPFASGIVALWSLAVLSFERFFVICRPLGNIRLQAKHSVLGLLFVWTFSFIWTFPPVLGWNRYTVSKIGTTCEPDWWERSIFIFYHKNLQLITVTDLKGSIGRKHKHLLMKAKAFHRDEVNCRHLYITYGNFTHKYIYWRNIKLNPNANHNTRLKPYGDPGSSTLPLTQKYACVHFFFVIAHLAHLAHKQIVMIDIQQSVLCLIPTLLLQPF